MALLYGAIYYPYPADSVAIPILGWTLRMVASSSAVLISIWDPGVSVVGGLTIMGKFPMQIVLDCAALDVQALYVAAVVTFPASWRRRLWGAVLGVLFLACVNVVRITVLYFVGSYAPRRFDLVHEDLLAFVMVALTCGAFAVWVGSLSRPFKWSSRLT